MKQPLEDDHFCFICGEKNPIGLHIPFRLNAGWVHAEFIPAKVLQGYKNIVHGGIIAAILDEAMVKSAILQNMPAVTAEISIRFKNPLLIEEKILIEAHIDVVRRKILEASSLIKKTDSTIIAEANAKLIKQN
jgi:acyl-coenzyme A thioesterase PaaI-like protein